MKPSGWQAFRQDIKELGLLTVDLLCDTRLSEKMLASEHAIEQFIKAMGAREVPPADANLPRKRSKTLTYLAPWGGEESIHFYKSDLTEPIWETRNGQTVEHPNFLALVSVWFHHCKNQPKVDSSKHDPSKLSGWQKFWACLSRDPRQSASCETVRRFIVAMGARIVPPKNMMPPDEYYETHTYLAPWGGEESIYIHKPDLTEQIWETYNRHTIEHPNFLALVDNWFHRCKNLPPPSAAKA